MFNGRIFYTVMVVVPVFFKHVSIFWKKTFSFFFFKLKNLILKNKFFIKYIKNYVERLIDYILYEMKFKEDFYVVYSQIIKLINWFYNRYKNSCILQGLIREWFNFKKYCINYKNKTKRRFRKFFFFLLCFSAFYAEVFVFKSILLLIIYVIDGDVFVIKHIHRTWRWFNLYIYAVMYYTSETLQFILLIVLIVIEDAQLNIKYYYIPMIVWDPFEAIPFRHMFYVLKHYIYLLMYLSQIIMSPFIEVFSLISQFLKTLFNSLCTNTQSAFVEYWFDLTKNKVYFKNNVNLFFLNSIWDYIIIVTIILTNLISLVLVLKTWECSKSFNKYQFVSGFFYITLNSWLLLNENNNLFLFILVILTELTSIFLLTIILLNFITEKKVKKNFSIWWLVSLIFLTTNTLSYTYFNYYASLYSQTNPLINFTYVCYTIHIYTIFWFIVILTWLILLLLHTIKKTPNNYNILYLWSSTKTFINNIVDSLNILCEPFLTKWNSKK